MKPHSELLFHQMALIRCVEQTLLDMFSEGLLAGTVHTCIGQEACAVGVVAALDLSRDIVFSNHRGHGHYLAYCGDVRGLIAEVMGLETGVCAGIGGSQHLQRRNFYSNGIQGAGAPVAVGMALAEARKESGAVAVVFLGDGTFGEGALYEAMNCAALWRAPIVFVVEHNRYAQSTFFELQHAGDLARRAEPFGIPVTRADGMNVLSVNKEASRVIACARSGTGPQLLFLDTYRFSPHSKGDDNRDPGEIAHYRQNDPLDLLRTVLGSETSERLLKEAITSVEAIVADLRS